MLRKAICAAAACALAATCAVATPASSQAAAGGRGQAEQPQAAPDHPSGLPPVEVPGAHEDELIVTARADTGGYQLQVADSRNDWDWRSLATILPEGAAGEPWTGYHCVTGDGNYVVAVIAPRAMSNDPAGRDRGGLLYRVSLPHGEITPIAANAATKYYNPGCGAGDRVAVISHQGVHQQATTVRLYDISDLALVDEWTVDGQLTSAVPLATETPTVAAARDQALVTLSDAGETVVAEPGGLPFQLRANTRGGADFLVTDHQSDEVPIWSASGADSGAGLTAQEVGTGRLGTTKLFAGQERTTVVNPTEVAEGAELHQARAQGGQPFAASSHGAVVAVEQPRGQTGDVTGFDAPSTEGDEARIDVQDLSTSVLQRTSDGTTLPREEPPVLENPGTAALPPGLGVASGSRSGEAEARGHSTPKCAVARNNLLRQAYQPNSEQVNWAIQQATRNQLQGSVLTRPASHRMWWLPAYEPSVEFERQPLPGAGDPTIPIPPSVAQAVFAQESNWKQASWRALPNIGGNPLIGDYYGARGTLDRIEYEDADCGYGISQITTPMAIDSTEYTDLQQDIAAVGYAANVAAGIEWLSRTWEEVYDAGVIANGGDPSKLENWYFALWAYNSGFYQQGGDHDGAPHGAWGLGWTNNPIQADYPPDRTGFLRDTYADAERPNDWPYQERIFGWMETPQLNYLGEQQYAGPVTSDPNGYLQLPPRDWFCDASNSCDPEFEDGNTSYCTLRVPAPYCWWNQPATWATTEALATSTFSVSSSATEPDIAPGSDDYNYPPNCSDLPPRSTTNQPHVIVESAHPNLNIHGCAPVGWSMQGTFNVEHGVDAHGAPLGEIDWHQLATGFSGHVWFTKNRLPGDTSHINTGTWTPPDLSGRYNVKAHVPPSGASTSSAHYVVHDGNGGTTDVYIDQHLHENRWVSLGNFDLQPGAKVTLNNVTADPVPGTANIAFDALAFTPVPAGGEIVDVTIDAALIFGSDQPTTANPAADWIVNNPLIDDSDLREWMFDHLDPLLSLPTCSSGSVSSSCLPSTLAFIAAATRNEVAAHENVARWQGFANPLPPETLPADYFDDPSTYKHHNRIRVSYRITADGLIDPASVTMSFQSQAGMTHLPPFMVGLFEYVETEYGITAPDLRYNAENLGTFSHSSTAIEPLEHSGEGLFPGRAFSYYANQPEITETGPAGGDCVQVAGIGGGIIGWKPALNEGGVAGAVQRWKDDIGDLVDDGTAPQALYGLADGIYHHWWSNQYGAGGYEGSPYRASPPLWLEIGFEVCGSTGSTNAIESNDIGSYPIAMSSHMPDAYLWRNGEQIDNQGLPDGDPVIEGDFDRFSRTQLQSQHPWGNCGYDSVDHYHDRRSGNPWAIDMIIDGKQLGNDVSFCRADLPEPPDH